MHHWDLWVNVSTVEEMWINVFEERAVTSLPGLKIGRFRSVFYRGSRDGLVFFSFGDCKPCGLW